MRACVWVYNFYHSSKNIVLPLGSEEECEVRPHYAPSMLCFVGDSVCEALIKWGYIGVRGMHLILTI